MEDVPIDQLRADPGNPRRIGEAELEALTRSIREFGFVDPVIARREDRTVIGGHQRVVAGRREGLKEVLVIFLDLTDEQARLLGLALNRISGEWDETLLADLEAVPDVDVGLSGFTEDEIRKLLRSPETREKRDHLETFDLDAALEAATKRSRVQPGEIWELGSHRLLCGDATQADQVAGLLDGTKVAMAFTDPPYNVAYGDHGDHGGQQRGSRRRRIANDAMVPEQWETFVRAWARNLLKHIDGAIYVCMSTKECRWSRACWRKKARTRPTRSSGPKTASRWAGLTTSASTSPSGTAGARGPSATGAVTGTKATSGRSDGPRPATGNPPPSRWN